ncbi:MAG: thermonuclease family protein [Kiritimatiellales bacterium]|nr:thermonuclease family protein [Kiritimatiellales bacterium]
MGQDRHKRTLAHLYIGERWINYEMIHDGWAKHYRKYSNG